MRRVDSGRCACLFESVVGGERVGRYSFVAASPFLKFEARAEVTVTTLTGNTPHTERFVSADPLEELKRQVGRWRSATLPDLPPFCSGAVGYAGYDAVRYVENLPDAPTRSRPARPGVAFFDHMLVFDNITKTMTVVAIARLAEGSASRAELQIAYKEACQRVDALVEQMATPASDPRPVDIATRGEPRWCSNRTSRRLASKRPWSVAWNTSSPGTSFRWPQPAAEDQDHGPAVRIYRTLRIVNPSPFMFYLRMPQVTLVGSSPEILCAYARRSHRPTIGWHASAPTDDEDRRLAEELLADPKERAEHVMLVDLGDNDVGRVARYGSVELSDVMTVERYSHVMHITSNVTGQLAPGRDAFDAMRACLPAGTVSGPRRCGQCKSSTTRAAPPRAIRRAVGYFDFAGNMDTVHRTAHDGCPERLRLCASWGGPGGRQCARRRIPGNTQ